MSDLEAVLMLRRVLAEAPFDPKGKEWDEWQHKRWTALDATSVVAGRRTVEK
jgi:hypothetical protein